MSRFYGTIKGSRSRLSTRCGHATTGLTTTAMTSNTKIKTELYVLSGKDYCRVSVGDRVIFEEEVD